MKNKSKSKKGTDEWIGLNKVEQEGIEAALNEMIAGKGIPHEEVMRKIKEKYNTSGMKSIKPKPK